MAGNKNQNAAASGGGLVGAIQAREREKQQMKQGYNNQAVQHAINQRQQLQAHQAQAQAIAYQQQMQQQQAYQQQQMYAQQQNMPQQPLYQGQVGQGGGRGTQQFALRPQPNAYGPPANYANVNPMSAVFAQGGGYSMPPGNRQMQQSPQPQFIPSPQGQQSPGTPPAGRGQTPFQTQYHGQAL